jgi:hypothetical protein
MDQGTDHRNDPDPSGGAAVAPDMPAPKPAPDAANLHSAKGKGVVETTGAVLSGAGEAASLVGDAALGLSKLAVGGASNLVKGSRRKPTPKSEPAAVVQKPAPLKEPVVAKPQAAKPQAAKPQAAKPKATKAAPARKATKPAAPKAASKPKAKTTPKPKAAKPSAKPSALRKAKSSGRRGIRLKPQNSDTKQ